MAIAGSHRWRRHGRRDLAAWQPPKADFRICLETVAPICAISPTACTAVSTTFGEVPRACGSRGAAKPAGGDLRPRRGPHAGAAHAHRSRGARSGRASHAADVRARRLRGGRRASALRLAGRPGFAAACCGAPSASRPSVAFAATPTSSSPSRRSRPWTSPSAALRRRAAALRRPLRGRPASSRRSSPAAACAALGAAARRPRAREAAQNTGLLGRIIGHGCIMASRPARRLRRKRRRACT